MPDVSSARAERLVNLVLCLLSTRQFLSAERIRTIVPGYADAPNDEAFFRMFERDKTELRELGVPLESGRHAIDTADGYRIARQDYELGEIDLESDEAAAVALAARLWESPELAGPAQGALVKLRAAGVEVDEDQGRAQPRVRGGEPAFGPLLAAVQAGRAVTFDYRRGGPAGEVARRTVEPWGVVSWRGRWYVVGHDRDREAPRSFRVSRIVGPVRAIGPSGVVSVPSDVDLLAMVRGGVEPAPVVGTARVWVAEGRAYGLRRLGRVVGPRRFAGRPGEEIELELRSLDTVARWLAGHGADIAVLGPPALAERVRANWEAAAAAHTGATPAATA
jgi:proteasome accessory factor B